MHWADQFAEQIINKKQDKEQYIVESGITPSGIVHAGNFREIMTQDLVYRALLRKGVDVLYLYIWDDFDRFRKVPKGIPNEWEQYIGIPISKTPDPWGCHENYAQHFKEPIVKESEICGVFPTYISMTEEYEKCTFSENMRIALENRDKIKEILDAFRKEPLADDWLPIRVYCEKCGKDTTKPRYLGDYTVSYTCECGHESTFDFRKKGIAKMVWRVCWPQRWKHYGVDFESSGKDHHAAGGSWDTGIRISKEVFNYEPPIGPMYEFIYAKGQKEKMSSSAGNVFTVSDLLEIYEPQIVRYIYTARINKAIEVPFDMGVYSYYNYYDLAERVYFGKEEVPEADAEQMKRCYEFSQIGEPRFTVQPPFLLCATISQITSDITKAIEIMQRLGHLPDKIDEYAIKKVELRLKLAGNWVRKYAPEQFRISVQKTMPNVTLTDAQKRALHYIGERMDKISDENSFKEIFGEACEFAGIKPKQLFEACYLVLLGRRNGPRLAQFILTLDKEFVAERFKEV
ncbi:MAG: lysine--tRNA ligase [Candidatus Diapherotrites archaeon]|nr:lysine--tRNA ligase [Candidatus Diapherotrites archaeon]